MFDKIMCKAEFPNEQWPWKELVHHLLNFSDQPAYVVEGDNKLLIHSRPQIDIWVGACQTLRLMALQVSQYYRSIIAVYPLHTSSPFSSSPSPR
jgi:hypothetical protein